MIKVEANESIGSPKRKDPLPERHLRKGVFLRLPACQSLSLWERWHCEAMTERASPARKSRRRSDRQALCQSDTIAAPVILGQQPCPLSRACARQLSQRGSHWHVGQASLRTTSQSASQTAPLVGEPLAKPFTLRGLPKPLPLGEVSPEATERASPAGKNRRRSDRQALCQSDTIAAPVILGQQPSPLSLVASSSPAPPEGEPLTERLFPNLFREFVENARLKRKEFVNVIKMRRRY